MGDARAPTAPDAPTPPAAKTVFTVCRDGAGLPVVEVDHLVVGAGPAGAAMGCFLGQHELKGLIISSAPSTAHTPRAHITNPATFECLRDIGIEQECYKVGEMGDHIKHTRFCQTFLGREYGRCYSWGQGRSDKYTIASPSQHVDLPQTKLEPILLRYAAGNGFPYRFSTELLSFEDCPDTGVLATVRDRITNSTYKIRAKYMYGADGAKSRIAQQLGLPFTSNPVGGTAYNVLFRADMSHMMKDRSGNLHVIMKHDIDFPDHAWMTVLRMVKPWYEWLAVVFPKPGWNPVNPTPNPEDFLLPVKQWLGDDSVPVEIIRVDPWIVNESSADELSRGNVFCLGDAVHRHPPSHGLGSNTCIQDAYNLAWKIGMVEKGLAGKDLLKTYNTERQPVAAHLVKISNTALRELLSIWELCGMFEPDLPSRLAAVTELDAPTAAGMSRRAKLSSALERQHSEFQGIGGEFNQRYTSGAVFQADQGDWPPLPEDPINDHVPSTYPGSRLPHAWLNTMTPGERFSTHDLAGKKIFTVFTGIAGGETWKAATQVVSRVLGIEMKCFVIGVGGDYLNQYVYWEKLRETGENGCLLVRPDRFVAWRSMGAIENAPLVLERVLRKILFREGEKEEKTEGEAEVWEMEPKQKR